MYMVSVDAEKCTGCEECANICPNEIFSMDAEKSIPDEGIECDFCESCLDVCEGDAIAITEV
jgi:Fe-S-cluster-containing hydrogenase component 2